MSLLRFWWFPLGKSPSVLEVRVGNDLADARFGKYDFRFQRFAQHHGGGISWARLTAF